MSRVEAIKGQPEVSRQLAAALAAPVHAYLFVGPAGCGKYEMALAFAADLLGDDRALRNVHPDVVSIVREGASISVAMAREAAVLALRSPTEGSRKVLILDDFHLVDEAAPALLKTIEEAPASTVFIVLAERVPNELITIASRCVRIDFRALDADVITERLVAEGAPPDVAAEAARVARGNVDRARLLAHDPEAGARMRLWAGAWQRMDGSGNSVASVVDEITAAIDHASRALGEQQETERSEIEEEVKEKALTGQALKAVDTRHKRELRRLRTDEIRSGLVVLSETLAHTLAESSDKVVLSRANEAIGAVNWANESLEFNPNETLLLQGLFARLSPA